MRRPTNVTDIEDAIARIDAARAAFAAAIAVDRATGVEHHDAMQAERHRFLAVLRGDTSGDEAATSCRAYRAMAAARAAVTTYTATQDAYKRALENYHDVIARYEP